MPTKQQRTELGIIIAICFAAALLLVSLPGCARYDGPVYGRGYDPHDPWQDDQ